MTTVPPPPAEFSELGLEVPVSEIESKLREFWEGDQDRARVSMMNLVVSSEEPGSLLENSRAIRTLAEEHACRAILTEIQRQNPSPSIRAWITAHCHLSNGTKATCSEQISFHLTGTASGRFRNTVFAHLHPDLPVIFWLQGELSSVFTERLAHVIDRLVVDSARWADPASSFQTILQTAEPSNPNLIIQDFAWTRSWQIRLSIAGMFDDIRAQSMIPDIDVIEISHSIHHLTTTHQLLAWLAVQAGWTLTHHSPLIFRQPSGKTIRIALTGVDQATPVSRILLSAGNRCAEFLQTPDSNHIERKLITPESRVVTLSPVNPENDIDLLTEQLSRGGRNSMFRKILPFSIELAAAGNRL